MYMYIIHVPYAAHLVSTLLCSHIMFRTSHNPHNCCTNMSFQCARINIILRACDGLALIHITDLQQTRTEKQHIVHIWLIDPVIDSCASPSKKW